MIRDGLNTLMVIISFLLYCYSIMELSTGFLDFTQWPTKDKVWFLAITGIGTIGCFVCLAHTLFDNVINIKKRRR